MNQIIHKIEISIRNRGYSDKPLVNYWLYFFLLSWLTLGIYGLVLFFQRIARIDKFINRKKIYYWNIIDYTEKYAIENNLQKEFQFQIKDLRDFYRYEFMRKIKEINGGISFLLIIVTLGFWGIIVLYKQNKAWDELQKFEQKFDEKLNLLWNKLGIAKYPLSFNIDTSIERSFILYLLLTIITLGIWGIVWEYKMHVDPDNIFHEFHSAEDNVLQTIRQ